MIRVHGGDDLELDIRAFSVVSAGKGNSVRDVASTINEAPAADGKALLAADSGAVDRFFKAGGMGDGDAASHVFDGAVFDGDVGCLPIEALAIDEGLSVLVGTNAFFSRAEDVAGWKSVAPDCVEFELVGQGSGSFFLKDAVSGAHLSFNIATFDDRVLCGLHEDAVAKGTVDKFTVLYVSVVAADEAR